MAFTSSSRSFALSVLICAMLAAVVAAPTAHADALDVNATVGNVAAAANDTVSSATQQVTTQQSPASPAPAAANESAPAATATPKPAAAPTTDSAPANTAPAAHANSPQPTDPQSTSDHPAPAATEQKSSPAAGHSKPVEDVVQTTTKLVTDTVAPVVNTVEKIVPLPVVETTVNAVTNGTEAVLHTVLPLTAPVDQIVNAVETTTATLTRTVLPHDATAPAGRATPVASGASGATSATAVETSPARLVSDLAHEGHRIGADSELAFLTAPTPDPTNPLVGPSIRALATFPAQPNGATGSDRVTRATRAPQTDNNAPAPSPSAPVASSAAGAFGGSIFVPLAILGALVALSMLAPLRRFRGAPGIPAPNPFICAFERPG